MKKREGKAMAYRTKTYIAADWDTDVDAVEQLHKWNDSKYWSLSFSDAHDLTQSYDSSLYCSIKSSLKTRMDASKTFVLIVGENTDSITKGGCQYCANYSSALKNCLKGRSVDYRSYIKYECDKAIEAGIKIIVLYNYACIYKSKCPEAVRDIGIHAKMQYIGTDGKYYWDYESVKAAFDV
jgi:hypothetical protein